MTNEYQVQAQRLTTITSAVHTVTFVPGATLRNDARSPTGALQEPTLDSIRVATPSGAVLRRFYFAHDYAIGNPGRLTLRHIFELDRNNVALPPWSFTYGGQTLPAYGSAAQDHWGYYNGRTTNASLLPAVVTPTHTVIAGADRSPDSTLARAGILQRVTFPTGGYNEFVFESNDYGAISGAGTQPIDVGPQQQYAAESELGTGPQQTTFTVNAVGGVTGFLDVALAPQPCSLVGCPYASLDGTIYTSNQTSVAVFLAQGSHTIEASDEFDPSQSAFISIRFQDAALVKRKVAGGLRIAEIRTADGMGSVSYRMFRYTTQADPAKSSGVISAEPAYAFQYTSPGCAYFSRSSLTRMPLGAGPVVGYSEVTVLEGASGEFGTTRHTFRSVLAADDDAPPAAKWPFSKRTSREWKRGQALLSEAYATTGAIQQRMAASYAFRDEGTAEPTTTRNFRGLSVHAFSGGAVGSVVLSNPFEVISAWTYASGQTRTVFDTTGTSSFSSARTFVYGNPAHAQLTQTTETNSDGTQRITNLKYPADYAPGSGNAEAIALTAMQDTFHVQGAVVERWVVKRAGGVDSVVSAGLTSYKLFAPNSAQYLPFERFTLSNPQPLLASVFVPSSVSGSFVKDSRYVRDETANSYDSFGRPSQLTDARSQATNYLFGGNPNSAFLTRITRVKDATGAIDLVTDLSYDTDGYLSSIRDEGGTSRFFTYDLFGRLRQVKNNAQTPTRSYGYTYSRQPSGWVFDPTRPNAVDDTMWTAPGTSLVTTQYLDGLGRVVQRVEREGALFHVAATEYDAMGRLWRSWKPYARSIAGFDQGFNAGATAYYNAYHSTSQSKPYIETLYRADALDRIDRVIPEYLGASPTAVTRQGYGIDAQNLQVIGETIDESAKRTRTFTSVFGDVVKTILGAGAPEATTTQLAYTVLGQRVKTTDPRGLLTSYALDTRGQLVTRTSPDAGAVSSKYDVGQNLRFSQDANQVAAGTVAFTSYDFAERPLTSGVGAANFGALDPNAPPTALETTTANWVVVRQYDAKPNTATFPWSRFAAHLTPLAPTNVAGRLAAVASTSNGAWQVTLFSYDADGRIVTRWLFTEANGDSVLTAANTTVTYTRDLRDALTRRQLVVGTYTFNQWYDYDARGLLWKVTVGPGATQPGTPDATYTYRPSGQVASRQFKNGPSVGFRYTIREQLETIGDVTTTAAPFSAKYSYNANGTINEAEFHSPASPATNKRYRYQFPNYDALNRLKSADYAEWTGSSWTSTLAYDLANLAYDANGNLTALQRYRSAGTLVDHLTYTIAGTSNRLTMLSDAAGSTAETWDAEGGSFTYDANGNLLTAPGPMNLTAASYDHRNLPTSLTASGTTTTYRYDEAGLRITKQVGTGVTELYLREGTTVLAVARVNAAGTLVGGFANLLAGDRVIGRQPAGQGAGRSYYHTDLLGSTRAVVQLTSPTPTIPESYDYDPWGVLLAGRTRTVASPTKEGFTSKERDAESQLDAFGARYYLSAVGRWGSVDPAAYADRAPEWSPYVYVRDEPVGVMDLWGLQGCRIGEEKHCPVFTGAQAIAAFRATAKKGATVEKVLQAAAVAAIVPVVVVGGAEVVTSAGLILGLRAAPAVPVAGKAREMAGRVVDVARAGATVFKTGHYASRLEAVGVSVARAESAVANEIAAIRTNMATGADVVGRLRVDNVLVEYRARLLQMAR